MADDGRTTHVLARAEAYWTHWGLRLGSVALPVLLDAALRLLHPGLHTTGYYVAGLGLLALTMGIAAGLQASRLPGGFAWTVPLLTLASIGLMRLVPEPTGLGILVVFPAMWLGIDKRLQGVVVTAVAVLVLQAVPGLVYLGNDPVTWIASLQLSLVATICAWSMAWIADRWSKHETELRQEQARLHDATMRLSEGQALNEAIMSAVDVGLVALRGDGAYSSMNPQHRRFMELAYPDGHRGYAGQSGWVFEDDGRTFLGRERMPTIRAHQGEEFTDDLIWVGEDPAERRALAVSAKRVSGGADDLASVLVYKDVTDLVRALGIKDDFVATVSHELRTPLTSILGYLELAALAAPEQDPGRSYLEVVHRNGRRLLRLVNDLLLTAQTERGTLVLDQRAMDLSEVVGECLRDLDARASAAEVRFSPRLQPRTWVCGDRERLAEVVENLLTNAVKYSDAGGEVRVRLRECGTGARRCAELSIADDGIGMDEGDRRQLFTKFFRTQEAQRRAIQGVGLGLSISKAIVEGHDGGIRVDSAPGAGTTFTVTLPTVDDPKRCDQAPPSHGTLGSVRA